MVPVVRNAEARDPWSSAAEVAAPGRSGARRQGAARGAVRLDHHHHQPGRAGRHRHHAGDQLAGSGDRRRQPHGRTADDPRRRVVARKMMNLSSSFDHRVVDGMVRGPVRAGDPRLPGMPRHPVRGVSDEIDTHHPAGHRRRSRRLRRRHPRRPARHPHHPGRRRTPGRHLPEHRLHSVQGADPRGRGIREGAPLRRRFAARHHRPTRRASTWRARCSGRTASSSA